MKVTRNYDSENEPIYRISFELTQAELIKAGWITRFSEMWKGSTLAKDYLVFLAKFAGIMPEKPTEEELRQQAANVAAEARAQKVNEGFESFYTNTTETFRKQFFGDFAFNGSDPVQRFEGEPSWCKVLGLKKTATNDEIKAKYRSLVKIHHPDKGGDPAKFNKIKSAYEEAIR